MLRRHSITVRLVTRSDDGDVEAASNASRRPHGIAEVAAAAGEEIRERFQSEREFQFKTARGELLADPREVE